MQFNFDNSYLTLPSELYSKCEPTAVDQPQMLIFNRQLAAELNIDASASNEAELAAVFSGNQLPEGAASIAQAYSGHQFGHFNRLGDGRALLLGEQLTASGSRFDLQFKGSGVTPYSRQGDGRATLSAMMREYLISEAMHGLGIPTTRSLAVVLTGEALFRETVQPGAVLTRVAASHIRVGTFQHIARFCPPETLEKFTNYTIDRHYPELAGSENPPLALLGKVMEQQADLIVNWMRVGFIHGVMNTDNMSISGETIDYGPCAFMNSYKPETVFSSIDRDGRYAFANQPQIAHWNLVRLAESLLVLIDKDSSVAIKKAEQVVAAFQQIFEEKYLKMLGRKIGIEVLQEDDRLLINNLLNWMYLNNADYTNTFVRLMYPEVITDKIYELPSFTQWEDAWKKRTNSLKAEGISALALMQQTNPVYIPRNQIVEKMLTTVTETGQTKAFEAFVRQLSRPYSTSNFDTTFMQAPAQNDEQGYKTYCGT